MTLFDPQVPGRPGRSPGSVDYRFARRATLTRLRAGELSNSDVCDAQRELMRVAAACGEVVRDPCPVCAERDLRLVRFVFGPRLPSGGRAVTGTAELRRLGERVAEYRCYVVEVCLECRWNHLLTSYLLGGRRRLERTGSGGG